MNDLTYNGVLKDLLKNPNDSINKLEAILVNRSTRLNDIKANIVQHERGIEPQSSTMLSGELDSEEAKPFENGGIMSDTVDDKGMSASTLAVPLVIGGLAIAASYYLFFKK